MRHKMKCDVEVCDGTAEVSNPALNVPVGRKMMIQNATCGHSWFTVIEVTED